MDGLMGSLCLICAKIQALRRTVWLIGLLALFMAGQAGAKPSRKAGNASSWKALAYRIEGRLDTLFPLVYENGQRALPWQGRVEAVLEAPTSEGIPVVM
ncbi:MAG: hypothetical protein ACKOQP_03775, partial [Bacteroidota bacterium]